MSFNAAIEDCGIYMEVGTFFPIFYFSSALIENLKLVKLFIYFYCIHKFMFCVNNDID